MTEKETLPAHMHGGHRKRMRERYRREGLDGFAPHEVLELILFIVLLILYVKKEDAVSITSIYLISYSVIRFLDEYLRGDVVRGIWGPFSTSQWISLAILIGTIIFLIIPKKRQHLV